MVLQSLHSQLYTFSMNDSPRIQLVYEAIMRSSYRLGPFLDHLSFYGYPRLLIPWIGVTSARSGRSTVTRKGFDQPTSYNYLLNAKWPRNTTILPESPTQKPMCMLLFLNNSVFTDFQKDFGNKNSYFVKVKDVMYLTQNAFFHVSLFTLSKINLCRSTTISVVELQWVFTRE